MCPLDYWHDVKGFQASPFDTILYFLHFFNRFEHLVVKIVPYTVLLSRCYLRPYWGETQSSPRSRETDSDRQNRRLTPSSVSITLNSLHIIRHRPGTGDRQQAPVTSLQRQASFSASFTEQCTRWQAGIYQTSPRATSYLVQHCYQSNKRYIIFESHISYVFKMIYWNFYFPKLFFILLWPYEQLAMLARHQWCIKCWHEIQSKQ